MKCEICGYREGGHIDQLPNGETAWLCNICYQIITWEPKPEEVYGCLQVRRESTVIKLDAYRVIGKHTDHVEERPVSPVWEIHLAFIPDVIVANAPWGPHVTPWFAVDSAPKWLRELWERTKASDAPTATCPRCGAEVPDCDGFGVVRHEEASDSPTEVT